MNLIMSMSFAGTVILVAYILLNLLFSQIFSARQKYNIMIMALFFYLIPIQIGKKYFVNIFNFGGVEQQGKIFFNIPGSIIQITERGEFYYPLSSINKIFYFVLGGVTVVIICFGLAVYFKQKMQIINTSERILDENLIGSINIIKEQIGIRRKIKYRISGSTGEPLTVGVFYPILVIPDKKYSKEEADFIYKHELLHIKNNDTFVKILGIFAIGLHWYNPVIYFLIYEINALSEIICDEAIAISLSQEQKRRYAKLILKAVTERQRITPFFTASFKGKKKRIEERILIVMNSKRKKKGLKILSCCIMGVLGLASSLTVLAYEQPTILKVKNIDGKNIGQAEAVFIVDDIAEEDIVKDDSLAPFSQTEDKMKITTEKYFLDEKGNIYDVYDIAIQPRCAHTYVNGTYNEHKKSGTGCTVYIYRAQRCSKCGSIVLGDFENKIDYAKCPH